MTIKVLSKNKNNITLFSENKEVNLGLKHIQNLQEAAELSKVDILFMESHQPEPVNLIIYAKDELVGIKFKNKQNIQFNIPLKNYTYLIKNLIL